MLLETPMITVRNSQLPEAPTKAIDAHLADDTLYYNACIQAPSARRLCYTCNQLKHSNAFTAAEASRFFGNCDACVHKMSEIYSGKRKDTEGILTKDGRHAGLIPQRMEMQKLRATMTYLKKRLQNVKYTTERLKALCGCDANVLKRHVESLMKEGMTWRNNEKWYITFKRPCKSFNLTDEHDFQECAHYTNLVLCWKKGANRD